MCRFAAYLGHPIALDELLFRPEHSIVDQSLDPSEGPVNGDGFGVGWYVPEMDEEPALYRNVSPVWADENMQHIAPRVRTSLCFAHVRGASPGMPVQETNCHPFVQGRLLFMHNGHIKGHKDIVRRLREQLSDEVYTNIRGTTDSEHMFAVVQDELGDDVQDPSADQLAEATRTAIRRIERLKREEGVDHRATRANVAVTDGRSMVAMRYASEDEDDPPNLYLSRAGRLACENGTAHVEDPGGEGAVLVSSDPMVDQDDGLDLLPENHLLVVDGERNYRVEPVNATAVA